MTGLSNAADASFTNTGSINIGVAPGATIGNRGISNFGTFSSDGEIAIANNASYAIWHDAATAALNGGEARFENTGTIRIGQSGNAGPGIFSTDNFDNSGEIIIDVDEANDAFVELVISNDLPNSFENSGILSLGHQSSAITVGLEINGDVIFDNLEEGTVDIRNVINGIDINNNGTFNNDGRLLIDNVGSGSSAARAIDVQGTFANTGLIGGAARNINLGGDEEDVFSGTLSPGYSPGLITFSNSLAFNTGSKLVIELEGTSGADPLEFDRINVAQVVFLDNLELEVIQNYTPEDGDQINFIDASVIDGNFASVDLPPGWSVSVGRSVTLTFDASAALPVELTNITAEARAKVIELTWRTTTETNNQGFVLERSLAGISWGQIGWIPGNGTTDVAQQYHFYDQEVVEGHTYFYRLKQIDFDGTYTYSVVVSATVGFGEGPRGHVYPNPVPAGTKLSFSVQTSVATVAPFEIMSLAGKRYLRVEIPLEQGGNTISLPTAMLPSGIYYLKAMLDETPITYKFVVQ
ncbi:MAG: T9SS type A sorting domain-containing protein [Bacteroidota bacterium]